MNIVAGFAGFALPASIIGFWIGYILATRQWGTRLSRMELVLLFVPVWAFGVVGLLVGAFVAKMIELDGGGAAGVFDGAGTAGAFVATVIAGWAATSLRILSKRK